MSDLQTRLLTLLPKDGTPRPNAELRRLLSASEAEYWRARDQLLDEGRVTKSQGRGGRTALVVAEVEVADSSVSKVRPWMLAVVFGFAAATLVAPFVYAVVSWGSDRLAWDALALFFGGVTVAALGVALLIYKVQADSAYLEAEGQARILKRLETLVRQAATSSADAKDILQAMGPAVSATSGEEAAPEDAGLSEDVAPNPSNEPGQPPEGATIAAEHGTYFRPSAIPLRLISDLVKWWDSQGEAGRWTLSRLIGGYRPFNKSGNFIGVPWILTFDDGDGSFRSFQISYSGRQKGSSVKELDEGGAWHEVERNAV